MNIKVRNENGFNIVFAHDIRKYALLDDMEY